MKLLLDEMIPYWIADELRRKRHDVQSIQRDRPELKSTPDIIIVRVIAGEPRTIVTNNVRDFVEVHRRLAAAGEDHAGIVLTFDAVLPRTRAATPLWVERLHDLLGANRPADALRNQLHRIV